MPGRRLPPFVPDRGALCTIIHTRPKTRAKGDPAMKKYFILGFATLLLAGMAGMAPAAKAQSTAPAPPPARIGTRIGTGKAAQDRVVAAIDGRPR